MDKNIFDLKPQLMVVISDYSVRERLERLLLQAKLPVCFVTHGHGSATSELLEYLGIGEPKKTVALGFADQRNISGIYAMLDSEIGISGKGRGIAFTIPLSSMNGFLYKACSVNNTVEGGQADMQRDMEMIMTVVNKGEFASVMEAAKSAGATGGTMIHARGLGSEEAAKFLGITINQEKDIVMILVPAPDKHRIMEAINNGLALGRAGSGICFALPVSTAFGLATNQG